MPLNGEQRFANFSEDRKYRYTLKIVFDASLPVLPVVGLNPSIADEKRDDPTVRRWIGYARQWGFGGILVLNLFAIVSTDPKKLLEVEDPVGPLNTLMRWQSEFMNLDPVPEWALASWGKVPRKLKAREDTVYLAVPIVEWRCLKMNADLSPAHPLYLSKTLKPIPWRKHGKS